MIYRMSDENKINFLEVVQKAEEMKKASEPNKPTLKEVAESQKAKKLNSKHDVQFSTSQHISSARTGGVSNMGGPGKFTKSESSNTIFDTNKSARMSQEIDSKTRVKNEKEEIASNKRTAEQNRMTELADTLRKTELSKVATVTPVSRQSGSNYYSPKNNMSIFDTQEFERLAEKTSGEKVTEEHRQRQAQKDESWKSNGKAFSSRDVINNLFENLTTKREK